MSKFKVGDIVAYVGKEDPSIHPFFYGNKYIISEEDTVFLYLKSMSGWRLKMDEVVSLDVFNSPLNKALA